MSRPIPEGVGTDPQYVCKCGWRGEFSQSVFWGHSKGYCPRCSENGYVIPLVLAADRDSEVARVNQPSIEDQVADLKLEQKKRIDRDCGRGPDKDALIRELVRPNEYEDLCRSLLEYPDERPTFIHQAGVVIENLVRENLRLKENLECREHGLRVIANTIDNPEGWATDAQAAEHYLTHASLEAARTTCPEAFDGCSENSTS